MNTIFFGTPDFAIASIRALRNAEINVSMICTRPARRAGRGRKLTPSPVSQFGHDLGIPVIAPARFDSETIDAIRTVSADAFVVAAYGRFIPPELLAIPSLGAVNIHPSLLPKHRGPSPVATSILNGDRSTGVTIILLDEGMDTGPILAQSQPVQIATDDRQDILTERLFAIGAQMLPDVLSALQSGELVPQRQDDATATITRLIRKEDGLVNWDASPTHIVRMNRAYHPWPGTSTTWQGELLKLIDIEPAVDVTPPSHIEPGTVFKGEQGRIYVRTDGECAVRLVTLQAAGRRAMSVDEFVTGKPDFIGSRLGAESTSNP